jgi:hypothetical protein
MLGTDVIDEFTDLCWTTVKEAGATTEATGISLVVD